MHACRSTLEDPTDDKKFKPRALLAAISGAKNESISPERYARDAEGYFAQVAARVYARYQEKLDENRALDFDDLLGRTLEMFSTVPEVLEQYQNRFPYLMVDEFQDTNVVQYELVRLLAKKNRNVCIVGDEDQSIYGWRKADVRNLQHFERDFPELKTVMLEQNYRSTQAVLDIASAVITPNEGRKPKRLWTENPRGMAAQLHEAFDERDEALFVVREIEKLRRDGHRYGDVAVTYRTNAQSRALEDAFVRYGLPYKLVGGTPFYQRREVKDVLAYLRLIGNTADSLSFERVVNVPARGIGQKTVADLLHWAGKLGIPAYQAAQHGVEGTEEINAEGRITPVVPMASRPRSLLGKFVTVVEGAQERLKDATLSETIESLLERVDYRGHLIDGTEEGNDRWQNVQELVSKLHDYDNMDGESALRAFLEEAALVQAADGLDSDAGTVTMITLHAAKGLEFPVVFIVGLEDGISPHSRAIGPEGTQEQLEEERRLLYVGVTRAEKRLFLVYAAERTLYGERREQMRSLFLDDVPASLLSLSFSQASGGGLRAADRTDRSFGGRSDGWGRRASSGFGSRGEAARYGQPRQPAPFKPSGMAGRIGSTPREYSSRDANAEFDVGVSEWGQTSASGAHDLGMDFDSTPDVGFDGGPEPRAISPSFQPSLFTPARGPVKPIKPAGPQREPRFGKGERVKHAEYGLGTVVVGAFSGTEELVLVKFDLRPDKPKNLSLSIHRLDPA